MIMSAPGFKVPRPSRRLQVARQGTQGVAVAILFAIALIALVGGVGLWLTGEQLRAWQYETGRWWGQDGSQRTWVEVSAGLNRRGASMQTTERPA